MAAFAPADDNSVSARGARAWAGWADVRAIRMSSDQGRALAAVFAVLTFALNEDEPMEVARLIAGDVWPDA